MSCITGLPTMEPPSFTSPSSSCRPPLYLQRGWFQDGMFVRASTRMLVSLPPTLDQQSCYLVAVVVALQRPWCYQGCFLYLKSLRLSFPPSPPPAHHHRYPLMHRGTDVVIWYLSICLSGVITGSLPGPSPTHRRINRERERHSLEANDSIWRCCHFCLTLTPTAATATELFPYRF